jgi:hypothetical protein
MGKVCVLLATLVLIGCASKSGNDALIGGGAGAVAGGVLGGWPGAAAGGALGGVGGAIYGDQTDDKKHNND